MPALSTTLTQPAANESIAGKHVPFTAFLRIVPIRGKRFETVRDMEKLALTVEGQIENICASTELIAFDYAKPIAFTPQFGDKTARLTIHGHACIRATFTPTPVGLQTVDNSDGILTGYGSGNASNRIPDTDVMFIATELKNAFEAATSLPVYRLEVAGFIFGVGGLTFPR